MKTSTKRRISVVTPILPLWRTGTSYYYCPEHVKVLLLGAFDRTCRLDEARFLAILEHEHVCLRPGGVLQLCREISERAGQRGLQAR